MTFLPVIPMGGLGGFAFLKRTRDDQQKVMEQTPQIKRNIAAFRERIGSVKTAEELVNDRQLLEVALGAFGLGDDVNNKYLVQKILESDPTDKNSLAARYSDKRYKALSDAFGFGNPFGPKTTLTNFPEKIVSRYADRQFEIAAGEVDSDMRLALAFDRDLSEIASRDMSDKAKWFTIMGDPPLRKVMETALGLPSSIGQLDLDRQLDDFRDRAERVFGTSDVSEIAKPEMQEKVVRDFLVRSQLDSMTAASYSSASIALALLNPGY